MTNIKEPEKGVADGGGQSREKPVDGSIWKVIDDSMRDVPEEALSRLPEDGAERHDSYLYGARDKAPRTT